MNSRWSIKILTIAHVPSLIATRTAFNFDILDRRATFHTRETSGPARSPVTWSGLPTTLARAARKEASRQDDRPDGPLFENGLARSFATGGAFSFPSLRGRRQLNDLREQHRTRIPAPILKICDVGGLYAELGCNLALRHSEPLTNRQILGWSEGQRLVAPGTEFVFAAWHYAHPSFSSVRRKVRHAKRFDRTVPCWTKIPTGLWQEKSYVPSFARRLPLGDLLVRVFGCLTALEIPRCLRDQTARTAQTKRSNSGGGNNHPASRL